MGDTSLSFLPFDNVWKMRIEHPYSLVVKDAALAWSCGQCPLDGEGAVLFPGDLLAQAEAVSGFIERYLGEMGCVASAIGRLVVYYAKTAPGDATRLKELFHRAFGPSVQVLPVAVPYFYYDGMLIEVDVFASDDRSKGNRFVDDESGMVLDVSDAGPFLWVAVSSHRSAGRDIGAGLRRLLGRANLPQDTLLAEQWFLPFGCEDYLTRNAVWVPDPDADITVEMTFAKGPVPAARQMAEGGLSVSLRVASGFFHLTALDASPDRDLVEQTAKIMEAVEKMFAEAGLSFRDVRKATTYYIAGSASEELHDNMAVRNRYYAKPGPASTGLPVDGLATPGARISISLFGATPRGR
jgi:enamine deaminase RidA (YjgF/YER057c/UK114 family)